MKVKSQSEVAQSCSTLSDLMDCSLPGSSIHGIFQARVLEWGAIAFSSKVASQDYISNQCQSQDLNLAILASLVAQRLKHLPAMWETWVQSLGQEDPLEKEMATHSSILAWRIPWTEEPGGLQSTGSLRVEHD